MYSQFIYGKFAGGQGGYKIVAHSEDLDKNEIKEIAQRYKFWGKTPPQNPKEAVGVFVEKDNWPNKLVFFQVNYVTGKYENNFHQYRYTLIPFDEMRNLGFRSDRLLIWLSRQEIPSIPMYNPNLQRLQIPMLEQGISKEKKQREAKLVENCLNEKDRQEKPFLLSAISALINGRRVLVNNVDSYLSAPKYLTSIFALLPAICRSEISVAVGNIDEQKCNWASLIVKALNSESVSLPQNCIWLNRMREAVIGYDSQNSWQSGYVTRIDEMISENPHNIPDIIAELDRITEPEIELQSLIRDPEEIFGSSQTSIELGLWGGPRSGKTTYLTMLHDSIQKGGSNLKIIDMDLEASRFVQYNSTLIDNGRFPPPTDPSQNYKPNIMTYRLMNSASLRRIEIPLKFVDAPGEFYIKMANYEEVDWQAEPVEEDDSDSSISIRGYIDYLIQCDGLIFMLSPDAPRDGSESYRKLFPRLFQVLRARARRLEEYSKLDNQGRLKQFIAFCVSKADRAGVWENRDRPVELAKNLLGEAVKSLPNYCYFDENHPDDPERNRCKFFAISSIGRYQNSEGQWAEAVQYPQGSSLESKIFYEDYQINQENESNSQEQPAESEDSDYNDTDDWGWEASNRSKDRSEETDSESFSEGATIDTTVEHVPFNVIAPVEWLIRSIQANPLSEEH